MKTFRVASFLAAMVGLWCALAFLIMMFWSEPTIPTCDGTPMTRGDLCGYSRSGGSVTHRNNFDDQLESDKETRLFVAWSVGFFAMVIITIVVSVATPVARKWTGEGSDNANS